MFGIFFIRFPCSELRSTDLQINLYILHTCHNNGDNNMAGPLSQSFHLIFVRPKPKQHACDGRWPSGQCNFLIANHNFNGLVSKTLGAFLLLQGLHRFCDEVGASCLVKTNQKRKSEFRNLNSANHIFFIIVYKMNR